MADVAEQSIGACCVAVGAGGHADGGCAGDYEPERQVGPSEGYPYELEKALSDIPFIDFDVVRSVLRWRRRFLPGG
jgi:hypothetical protein